MNLLNRAKNLITALASGDYIATKDRGRRQVIARNLTDEDSHLGHTDRQKLTSNTRDLRRNAALCAWAVNKHLDFVSRFRFNCVTGDEVFDEKCEQLMRKWSKNCDISGRFSLSKMIRLLEASSVIDGDAFFLKTDKGKLQLIEADRIATPSDLGDDKGKNIVQGVSIDQNGAPIEYYVCKRASKTNRTLEKKIKAQYIVPTGWFDRYDQVRGITPLVAQ